VFIDYVGLLLINMSAGLFLLAGYLYKGIESKQQKKWSPALAISGFIATSYGCHMTWHWPLPGSYNVAFGEMSVLLGALFLGAAFCLAMDWDMLIVAAYGFFSGLAATIVGCRIINLGMTKEPLIAGIGFILTGLCGIFSAPALYFRANRFFRLLGSITLIIAALIWARTGYMACWSHLADLAKWMPATMR